MLFKTILIFAIALSTVESVLQEIYIFKEPSCQGDGLLFRSKQSALTTYQQTFIDAMQSIRVLGFWTGYSTPEFQPEELLNKHDYTGTCSNYSASGLKSLRFMGQIDTSTAFISLYNGTPGTDAFSGDEKIVTRASSDFSFTPTGVIISNAANWTGYENADFTGRAICFRSSTPGLTTFDLMTDSRVVKSVVKGCIS